MSLLGVQRLGSGPLVVWLHGFTQTSASAHQFRTILAGTYELLTVDLPGHGVNSAIEANLSDTAELLREVLPREPFILGGYSFGARVALHLALAEPTRVRALVVLGASRGIEDGRERLARRERDHQLAERIERIGTDAFLDEWLRLPMFASLPPDPRERAARSRDPHGLAASLRLSGTGSQQWLEPSLSKITCPTLALAGALDHKFSGEAAAIAAAVARGAYEQIGGAHHAAHLEQPDQTARLVHDFISRN